MATTRYESVIGLEVHAQVLAATKLFCRCRHVFGAAPETVVCPVCLGLPGALPVLQPGIAESAARAALALNCTVNSTSWFTRKHYFYPDLPKGYQITQGDTPLAENGWLVFPTSDGTMKKVRIRRVHVEEDAARTFAAGMAGVHEVDHNRAGVPLVEVVTHPESMSVEDAVGFLRELRSVLRFLGTSTCDMDEGAYRCDANISIREQGATHLGARVELKNLNSFRFIARALSHEFSRQTGLLSSGEPVVRETRGFDPASGRTIPLRAKEITADYRYLPEPDLPPLVMEVGTLKGLESSMPMLPADFRDEFSRHYGFECSAALMCAAEPVMAEFTSKALRHARDPKLVQSLVTGDLISLMRDMRTCDPSQLIPAEVLAGLANRVTSGIWSLTLARRALALVCRTGCGADGIEEQLGRLMSEESELDDVCRLVVSRNPQEAARYAGGKAGLLRWFLGQVMKASAGRADPACAEVMLKKYLEGYKSET